MQRLCSSCLRGLKMGLAPSFPIETEPVLFEPSEVFSSTGKRRVVDDEALQVVRCSENLEEDIYKDIVTRNQYRTPHDHLEHINFEHSSEKYPTWTHSNIAEFRLEFMNCDEDDDALLNFDDVSNVLDKLGDDSPTNIRFHCFVQTMKSNTRYPELGNKVDFQDFLELCHLLCQVREREASCDGIKLEASGVSRTDSARPSPSPSARRTGRLLSPRTRRSADGSASPQLSASSSMDSPGCKPKAKTLCACPLADISETEADSRVLRGKSGKGKVKSQPDHVDNILRNHCVIPGCNMGPAHNKLGNAEGTTGLELADSTRYSVSSDHRVPNNRVT